MTDLTEARLRQIIEAMALAAWIAGGGLDGDPVEAERRWSAVGRGIYIKKQKAALTALEAAIPGLADVIAGKAAIVPNEATADMQERIWLAAQLQHANSQYAAMIATTPYRRPE